MKSILISIKQEWVAKILNGEKTIEIRKTMPKCDLPIDVYIYCTKDDKNDCFINISFNYHRCNVRPKPTNKKWFEKLKHIQILNGKVVAKFTLNKVEEITVKKWNIYVENNLLKESCLHESELFHYIGDFRKEPFYAWHIDNLEIFDKPKELCEFIQSKRKNYDEPQVQKAPQSWCYVEALK